MLFILGVTNIEKKKIIKGQLKTIQVLSTLDPKWAEAYCGRGCSYRFDGQYDKAIEDCTKAIALDPNRIHSYFTRGVSFAKLKQFDKSLKDLNMAIKQYPNYADAYYERSLVYKQLGRYKSSANRCQQSKAAKFQTLIRLDIIEYHHFRHRYHWQ